MGIKDRVKSEVQKIIARGHQVEQEVIAFVRDDYKKTLDDVGKGMNTVRETTSEYLSGVEEGLNAAGHKSEELLQKTAHALVDVARELCNKSLEAAQKNAHDAKSSLNAALEKVQGPIDNVDEKIKKRMQDAHSRLTKTSEAGKTRLKAVGDGIDAYAGKKKDELSDSANAALHKAADRSMDLVQKLAKSTEEQNKKLLSHSLDTVAGWLAKLADKVKPKD